MNAKKPVIAALNGPAAGLGLVLALYADTRFAGGKAKFTTSFAQAGFMDEVMAYARTLADTVSPRSMAVIKAQIWQVPFQDFATALAVADSEMQKSFKTEDFKEGVAYYLEKRAPAIAWLQTAALMSAACVSA